MENLAKGIRWNLGDLYASPEDPKIASDLKEATSQAVQFENKYKSIFENPHTLSAAHLKSLLKEYKQIAVLMRKPMVYAQLAFSEKTNAPAVGAFLQKIQVTLTDIGSHLLFWEVIWSQLDPKIAEPLLQAPELKEDHHYLEQVRKYGPYTLKENEEKIMAVKENTSGSAFSRLFDEVMNNIPFYLDQEGKKVKKTEGEVLSLFHSPNREERKKASQSLAEGLQTNTHLLTYIYNMILADHRSNLKIRGYQHPMDSRNLANETNLATVSNLIDTVKKNYKIAHRYYELKRNLLGLGELYDYDRYAPIDSKKEQIHFDECKRIVLAGYHEFSPKAGEIAKEFFDKKWIDAEIREGKQGGGFCCDTTPELHPYILVNYTGSTRDVMTVAHELGHGLHQYLARRAGILESSAPLTMAETASVFGEMIIFDELLASEKDPAKRLALICGKIDDNFSTVFRQITMTAFELKAHEAGLAQGELSSEVLSDFWMEANTEFYGKSVILTENYRNGWKYIPHFIHTPFYCYAYAFAQLVVLALYQKYKENKTAFIPAYFEMLSLGGSRKPEELAGLVGLDIARPDFWQLGLGILEKLVKQAEELSAQLSLKP